MAIKTLPIRAFTDNYIWIIVDTLTNNGIIVDPGAADPVNDYLEKHNINLQGILVTHHHADHTGGISQLTRDRQIPVYGPLNDQVNRLSHKLTDKQTISLLNEQITFNIMELPGHTKGHIAYYNDDLVFCGDTLFAGGCGRIFEGTAKQMLQSLHKLANLPLDTKIFCAHEYTLDNLKFAKTIEPDNKQLLQRIENTIQLRAENLPTIPSTIKLELETNPFLRCNQETIKNAVINLFNKPLSNEEEVFAELRSLKDNF